MFFYNAERKKVFNISEYQSFELIEGDPYYIQANYKYWNFEQYDSDVLFVGTEDECIKFLEDLCAGLGAWTTYEMAEARKYRALQSKGD